MILFQEDWGRYPGAIVDTSTTNHAFKRLAVIYREMGVKNHAFPLALHNPELQGVDPHSLDLSSEQIMMITMEAKENPWYYFREIARAPGLASPEPIPFKASRGNIGMYWMFFNHITTILVQIRQTGKSFGLDSLTIYLMNVGVNHTQINLITKDETLRSFNLARLKSIQETLPYYLNLKRRGDLSNTEMMTIGLLGNEYRAHLPNSSPTAALKVGRGLTSPVFQVDEFAFDSNIGIILPSALSAGTFAREEAKRMGSHFGTILATTAGKKDDRDGKYAYGLIEGSAIFTEAMYDAMNLEDLESIVRKNASQRTNGRGELRVYMEFDHLKLGYNDAWLLEQLERSMSKGDDADRDFFNRWTSGSQASPLSIELGEIIRKSEVREYYSQITRPYGYISRWYMKDTEIDGYMHTHKTTMGIDSSDAAGGDDISMCLRDIETGALMCAGNYNETNLITFCEWIVDMLVRYENITLIIERRSTGAMIIDYLLLMLPAKGIDPFKRLYNKVVQEALDDKETYREICKPMYSRSPELYTKHKKSFGFATSATGATSRSELYSTTLQNSAKYTGSMVRDKKTIDQILGLIIKNGRVDHADGEHDDCCFVGSTLVRTIHGNRPIKELKLGDLVLTREGYKPIIKLFCNEKEVINQYGLTGTPSHPFITPNGEVQFKDLELESEVYTWNEKLSTIEVKTITDILNLKERNIETISTDTTPGKHRLSHYIDRFTKITTDLYYQSIISTIKTVITRTMQSRILKCLAIKNTLVDTQCLKRKEKDAALMEGLTTNSQNGKKKTQNLLKKSMLTTAGKIKHLTTGEEITQNSVNRYTKKPVEKAKKQERRTELVYNIMVDDCHEYFVNDILVHNCISWMLSFWLMTQGKNLEHYGISAKSVLSKCDMRKKEVASGSDYEHMYQDALSAEIESLIEQIKNERDNYISMKHENKLKVLLERYRKYDTTIISTDELLKQINQDKTMSLRMKGQMYR